jgi:hypothetical protein
LYIPVLWLFYPAIKPIAQFTEIAFRLSVDCDHHTLFYSFIFFYTILSFLWSLLLPVWSCQFTLTCISSRFILCQIHLATFDLLYPLLPLSCLVVWCTHIRCFLHVSVWAISNSISRQGSPYSSLPQFIDNLYMLITLACHWSITQRISYQNYIWTNIQFHCY